MLRWLTDLDPTRQRVLAGTAAAVAVVGLLSLALGVTDSSHPAAARSAGDVVTNDAADSTSSTEATTTTSPSLHSADGDAGSAATSTTARAGAGAGAGSTTTTRRSGTATTTTVRSGPTTAPTPSTTATTVASGPACNPSTGPGTANNLASRFCSYRAGLGLPTMQRTSALDQIAASWAQQMAQQHQTNPLPHNPNMGAQVFAACISKCSGASENVAYITEDGHPELIWQGWLNSPSHRAAIEDHRDGEFGIGVAKSSDGWVWVVQDFGWY